jgi:hypothetical protein
MINPLSKASFQPALKPLSSPEESIAWFQRLLMRITLGSFSAMLHAICGAMHKALPPHLAFA